MTKIVNFTERILINKNRLLSYSRIDRAILIRIDLKKKISKLDKFRQ